MSRIKYTENIFQNIIFQLINHGWYISSSFYFHIFQIFLKDYALFLNGGKKKALLWKEILLTLQSLLTPHFLQEALPDHFVHSPFSPS